MNYKEKEMRLNKTLKAISVALPLMALAACSSNTGSDSTDAQVTDTNSAANSAAQTQATVQATAAAEQARIEEIKRKTIAELKAKNIVYFEFDKSTVSDEFARVLDAHAKFLSANSDKSVLVEGHTDARGTPEYNIALGERRAKAVVSYLEALGVDANQLSVVSYGEEKPMVKDRSEAAFAKNRRAVLVYK